MILEKVEPRGGLIDTLSFIDYIMEDYFGYLLLNLLQFFGYSIY